MRVPGNAPLMVEDERKKSLRFDRDYLQSAMYKHAPYDLALSYTRTVMGFLLLQPAPRHILIIGLGGGSLSKYCYKYLPEATVTSVEIDGDIIALRDQFEVPPDDERFRVVHADGADFIAAASESFDVIVLDGYGPDGLPEQLSSMNFYDRCASALSSGGILVANFLESDRQAGLYISRLRTIFDEMVVKILSERGGNRIAFALRCEHLPSSATLRARAAEMETRYRLGFPGIAARMLSDLATNPRVI